MEQEIWKDIKDYEGYYQVSNLGRVKSLARVVPRSDGNVQTFKEKIKKQKFHNGYAIINLSKNGSKKTRSVHQLVAIAFLGHKPCGMKLVVNHIDNDKANNKVGNLELVSNRYNSSVDRWRHGKTSKYTGVCLHSYYKDGSYRWQARIRIGSKHKHLGYFRDEEEAAAAYQEALEKVNRVIN